MTKRIICFLLSLYFPLFQVMAAPLDGTIIQGNASISQQGNHTTILQNTDRVDINWQEFSIVADESVTFNQPDATSLAINRVIGGVPSQIEGAMNANGRIFVINNAGITFGAGAQINVGSLLATTHEVVEHPDGSFTTEADHYGTIVNNGNIHVSQGGFAILAAPYVENNGFIQADLGQVHLASGTKSTLDLRGDGKILFTLEDGEDLITSNDEPLGVSQNGTVQARSGSVYISAKQASDAISSVINLDGLVDATSFASNGDGGTVLVASDGHIDMQDNAVLDASADQNGNGGRIEVLADNVAVARENATMRSRGGSVSGDGGFMEFSGYDKLFVLGGNYDAEAANGTRGTILFDPTDVIIDGTGGDFTVLTEIDQFADPDVGGGTIVDTILEGATADVIVQANNDITVSAALAFQSLGTFSQLTLEAGNDILINANISAASDFDVVMDAGNAITMADGTEINVGAGLIDLTAVQDITVSRLVTTNSSATAIQLTSSSGGIVDGGDTGGADIVAANGTLVADSKGFGTANAIETTVSAVDITVGNNTIRLVETDGLTLAGISTNPPSTIDLTIGASFVLTDDLSRTGNGDLSVVVTGADNNLTINTTQSTNNGNLTLSATGNVTFAAGIDAGSVNGNVSVTADSDSNNTGALTMDAGTLISSSGGRITLSAGEDITLGSVQTGNADSGGDAVTITSSAGGIIDGSDAAVNVIAASGTLNVTAATGFGSATATGGAANNAIETTVSAVDITAGAGAIRLVETDAVTLTTLSNTTTFDLDITTGSALTLASSYNRTGAGKLSFTVSGANNDLTINAAQTTSTGNATFSAAGYVLFGANGDITSTSGNVTVVADNDNSGAGGITMDANAVVDAGSGLIDFDPPDDVTLGTLTTTSSASNAVSITTSGALLGNSVSGNNINTPNGTAQINAGSVGTEANPLELNVDTLQFTVDGGDSYFSSNDAYTIASSSTNGGDVNFVVLNPNSSFDSSSTQNINSNGGALKVNDSTISAESSIESETLNGETVTELLTSITKEKEEDSEKKKKQDNNQPQQTAENGGGCGGSAKKSSGNVSVVSLPGSVAIWSNASGACNDNIQIVKGICSGSGCMVKTTQDLVFFVPDEYEDILEPVIVEWANAPEIMQAVVSMR
jgi:filamentous hemagglutinin family protein